MSKQPWKILSEDIIFDAMPFVGLSRQTVEVSDGRIINDYYQVQLSNFAIACAVTVDGEIITLWQYKHGARRYGLTFPAGMIKPGEDPLLAMRRELLEETGYVAGAGRTLGSYVVSGNQGCGTCHVFLFRECKKVAEADAGDLEAMDLRLMSKAAVDRAIADGSTAILTHLAVWALAAPLLSNGGGQTP
jgi:ADP-ribose pyrophosphatase